jgi:chorismate-pyruvate lyase
MSEMSEMETTVPKSGRFELKAAHPLDQFYARAGLPLPPLTQIDGEAVPEPYKGLLVHRNDMTPTLENYHRQQIHLQVLGRERKGEQYFREVVLLLDGSDLPVEFGAIKIYLDLLAPMVREEILAEQRPLGHILAAHRVQHRSQPSAFLRLASDPLINQALKLSGAQLLFGRHNDLLDGQDRVLAEIVEILPPIGGKEGKR